VREATDLIAHSLDQLAAALEAHLQQAEPRGEPWTALTDLVASDGTPNPGARDRVVICVAAIVTAPERANLPPPRGGPGRSAPPLLVELDLVFVANFGGAGYPLAPRLIERVLAFLHARPVLTRDMAALDPAIDRLAMAPTSPDHAQLAVLASRLGIRGQPILCYRLRAIPVDG
jgi:hypothetical protein